MRSKQHYKVLCWANNSNEPDIFEVVQSTTEFGGVRYQEIKQRKLD